MFKCLVLIADLHLIQRKYDDAIKAVRDLETIQKNDPDVYVLKAKVIMHQQASGEYKN